MMEGYRKNPPSSINGISVAELYDYEKQEAKDLVSGKSWKLELPKSNVLQFVLSDGSVISARPSGTEPKIKFYFSVNEKLESAADYDRVDAQLEKRIKGIIADMNL
jgi:phosphoglucomutase